MPTLSSEATPLDGESAESGRRPLLALSGGLLAAIAVLIAIDLATDYGSGAGVAHVAVELCVILAAAVGFVMVLRALRREIGAAKAEQRALARDLSAAREDAARFRAEAESLVHGLARAIDAQLDRWGLTAAEQEIALLLLKGLSLKDIGGVRGTSERTVRQQALAIYKKSGLAGRAELAAFFLEDLLGPRAPTAR